MNCKKKGCNQQAETDGLCNVHWHHTVWLDNTDINNLGIVKFAHDIVPEWVRNETPEFHRESFKEFINLYSKDKHDKYDRLLEEIGFRGAAKTTRSKIILMYVCCFALEKFVAYCSETNAFAVQDVFEVRRELTQNPKVRYYFGKMSSKKVMGSDGEWSKDAYMTVSPYGRVYVLARGVGQQIRSALRNSYRPTLAIINDMDSKNTVKTEYTRAEQQKWFFNDMFNAVDDIEGKVFFNGTILHEDTVAVVLERNDNWKTVKYPVMDFEDFQIVLKECSITDVKFEIPSDKKIEELEKKSKLYWKERLNLKYILKKAKEAYESHQMDGFYQEYFHIISSPDAQAFKSRQVVSMRFFRTRFDNWLAVKFSETAEEVIFNVNTYIGLDPASSTTLASKFSVVFVVAMNKERQLFLLHYARGKFGLRDEFITGYIKPGNSDVVEYDRSKILRTGMVDEEIRLQKQYNVRGAMIETVQQQQSVFDEINRIMRQNGAFHQLQGIKPITEKIERAASILMPFFQSKSIFINRGMQEFEHELDMFPRSTTMDTIDACSMAAMIAHPPEGVDYVEYKKLRFKKEDEYTHEFFAL